MLREQWTGRSGLGSGSLGRDSGGMQEVEECLEITVGGKDGLLKLDGRRRGSNEYTHTKRVLCVDVSGGSHRIYHYCQRRDLEM